MTITSASQKNTIAHIPLPETLLSNHPARQYFALSVRQLGIHEVTVAFQHLDPSADSSMINSLLGCMVDCAARLAGQAVIGACGVLEQELHVKAASDATRVYATAHIESSSTRYAIYQCTVFAEEADGRRVLADSQGTLLKGKSLKGSAA